MSKLAKPRYIMSAPVLTTLHLDAATGEALADQVVAGANGNRWGCS